MNCFLHVLYYCLIVIVQKSLTCPDKCTCRDTFVLCRGKGLNTFPSNIPASVTLLDLRDNFLRRLSKTDLKGLVHLEVLLISHNHMRFIDENALSGVPKLRKLYASRNKLDVLPSIWSANLCYLEQLDLHANRITQLNDDLTQSLPYIRTLNLAQNNIQTVPESLLKGSQLEVVNLEDNPLNCDCRWLRVQSFLKGKQGKQEPLCYNPVHLKDRSLLALSEGHLKCYKSVVEISKKQLLLKCSVRGYPIEWLYKNRKLDEEYNGEYEIFANGTILVDESEKAENFKCAINHYLHIKRKRRQLRVPAPPRFLIKPKDRSYYEGTAVRIVCQAIGYPRPRTKWFFNNKQLETSTKYELNDERTDLIIYPFLERDVGKYKCVAENSFGWREASAYLSMIASFPPEIIEPPQSISAPLGSMVTFVCRAKAVPQPSISWAFDGNVVPIVKGHHQVSLDGTTLTIGRITRKDSGTYTCVAGNSVGSMSADARLVVTASATVQTVTFNEFVHGINLGVEKTSVGSNRTITKQQKATSPHELLKWFQFAKTPSDELNRTIRIYEESVRLIQKHVEKGLALPLNQMAKNVSFDAVLPQPHIDALVELTGCTVTQQKNLCDDDCYHSRYRTFDGQCNNRNHTKWGASFMPFNRLLPPVYENGFNTPVGWDSDRLYLGFRKPNARTVSRRLFQTEIITPHETFSSMVMQWGQFIDHDIDFTASAVERNVFKSGEFCNSTCENVNPCFNIQLRHDDPKFKQSARYPCIEFERSSPVCGSGETSLIYGQVVYREQMNTLTSYIDGSVIYGSTDENALDLRELEPDQGFLRYDILSESRKPYLPFDTDSIMDCKRNKTTRNSVKCFLAGDVRANEQLGLLSMHTIFMREHNRVAMRFAQQNPRLDGETIFQESRKIVAAELQHITFYHWLPRILGKDYYDTLIGPYDGYKPEVNPTVSNAFATAAYRFGHTLINPFLHRYERNFEPYRRGHVHLRDAFFSPETIIADGIDPILRGLLASPMKKPLSDQLVNNELTEKLFHKAHQVSLDLIAINIQRGRDHGLPSYTEYRKWCNLTKISRWEDLRNEMSDETVYKLRELYGHPDNIDLFSGGIAEKRQNNSLIGPTFACIVADQFRRLRDGDRFWYEREGLFTKEQLNEIKKTTLSRIVCENADDIERIQKDAFLYVGRNLESYGNCKDLPRINFTPWRRCCYRLCSIANSSHKQSQKKRRSIRSGCEYRGNHYKNEQTWRQSCSVCKCQENEIECREDTRCLKRHKNQTNWE